jgi:hypothetical protein
VGGAGRGLSVAIEAVLFDVGGPLNTEIEHERQELMG